MTTNHGHDRYPQFTTQVSGLIRLEQCAVNICDLFIYADDHVGSPAWRLVNTYRAAYQGMNACYGHADFYGWEKLAYDCDSILIQNKMMPLDIGEG